METINIIFILIALVLSMIGVIMIFDARKLTQKWFGFNDQNEGSKWFKIGGFVLAIIGAIIIFITFKI